MYETVVNLFNRYWRIDEKQRRPKNCKNGIKPTKIYREMNISRSNTHRILR
jgi:hypothetical protein